MKKIILINGIIAGTFLGTFLIGGFILGDPMGSDMSNSQIIGYLSMLLALSLVFVGVKQIRDKHLSGEISFGMAFKVGMFIVIIANFIYSSFWTIYVETSNSDFYEVYAQKEIEKIKSTEPDPQVQQVEIEKSEKMIQMFGNPFLVFLFTFLTELLPVGLVISLIAALIFKRKKLGVNQ